MKWDMRDTLFCIQTLLAAGMGVMAMWAAFRGADCEQELKQLKASGITPVPPVQQIRFTDVNHPVVCRDAEGFYWSAGKHNCRGCHTHQWSQSVRPVFVERWSSVNYDVNPWDVKPAAGSFTPETRPADRDYHKYLRQEPSDGQN